MPWKLSTTLITEPFSMIWNGDIVLLLIIFSEIGFYQEADKHTL